MTGVPLALQITSHYILFSLLQLHGIQDPKSLGCDVIASP